ncbi:MFS transporter [Steroidobacter agaridevorans]|uniref:MFS transporter n=1 Tax=Steroidobacter agaridevorans TaxID=2695856 RepID=A0A829YHP7_9GAMM|nr:MFS transporter [Steroidobacter agaridevorans]GFE82076.1 MFS transporter [Steroidobacter agaridevorans]GFE85536.1 MFS transporter [Steroidobacter agaridevorans]
MSTSGPSTLRQQAGASWLVAVLFTCCFTLSYVDRHVISLLVEPIKSALVLSDTQIGVIQGLSFSVFYVLASLPLAHLSDRGNRPRIIAACIAVWSCMTMLCGLAVNFWHLLLARIGVAAAESGLPPAALTMMADTYDPKRLVRATSIFMLAPYLGGAIALVGGGAIYAAVAQTPWPAIPGIGPLDSWQWVFIMAGAPGMLVALIVLCLLKEPRTEASGKSDATVAELVTFLRTDWRPLMAYIVATALVVLLFNAQVAWVPAALMRAHGMDAHTVGLLFGPVFLVAGAIGTLGAGMILGKARGDVVTSTVRLMRLCALVALPAAVIGPQIASVWIQLTVVGVSLLCSSAILGMSTVPLQFIAPKPLRARIMALQGLVCALIGTGLGPLLVGVLSDQLDTFASQSLTVALSVIAVGTVPLSYLLLGSALRSFDSSARASRPERSALFSHPPVPVPEE